MVEHKVALILQTCTERLSQLRSDPSCEVYLTTELEPEGSYRCLHYSVSGVPVLRVTVRKEDPPTGDVSFALSESPIDGGRVETERSEGGSVGVETEGGRKNRKTYSLVRSTPFEHKPSFARTALKKKTWRRALSVTIPEEQYGTPSVTPAWEDIARFPRPSHPSWPRGTKQSYEDSQLLSSSSD